MQPPQPEKFKVEAMVAGADVAAWLWDKLAGLAIIAAGLFMPANWYHNRLNKLERAQVPDTAGDGFKIVMTEDEAKSEIVRLHECLDAGLNGIHERLDKIFINNGKPGHRRHGDAPG